MTVITPTGDRPLTFALCRHWMARQTLKPDQWIVVDDGQTALRPDLFMKYIRRLPGPADPKFTMLANLTAALPEIAGDKIIFFEDDEYYAPDFIATMARQLDRAELAGIMRSKYYHLPSGGYFKHTNIFHASLAETGFRRGFLNQFKTLLNESRDFLDIRIWRSVAGGMVGMSARPGQSTASMTERMLAGGRGLLFDDVERPLYLGMKGLPGRTGIGIGHNAVNYPHFDSTDRRMLRQWIPDDYKIYFDILDGTLTTQTMGTYFEEH